MQVGEVFSTSLINMPTHNWTLVYALWMDIVGKRAIECQRTPSVHQSIKHPEPALETSNLRQHTISSTEPMGQQLVVYNQTVYNNWM